MAGREQDRGHAIACLGPWPRLATVCGPVRSTAQRVPRRLLWWAASPWRVANHRPFAIESSMSQARRSDDASEGQSAIGTRLEFLAVLLTEDFRPAGCARVCVAPEGVWFHVDLNRPARIVGVSLTADGERSRFELYRDEYGMRGDILGKA